MTNAKCMHRCVVAAGERYSPLSTHCSPGATWNLPLPLSPLSVRRAFPGLLHCRCPDGQAHSGTMVRNKKVSIVLARSCTRPCPAAATATATPFLISAWGSSRGCTKTLLVHHAKTTFFHKLTRDAALTTSVSCRPTASIVLILSSTLQPNLIRIASHCTHRTHRPNRTHRPRGETRLDPTRSVRPPFVPSAHPHPLSASLAILPSLLISASL